MQKLLKISLPLILIFFFSYCGSDINAKDIHATIYLSRILGSSEAELDLAYHSGPVGSFTIDEVWVNNKMIAQPKKRATASVGGNGFVYRAEGVSLKEKAQLDENKRDIKIKTKWTGESQREFVLNYNLPSLFKVASVSNTISKTQALKLELKDALSKKDWDSCSVEFSEKLKEAAGKSPWHGSVGLFSKDNNGDQLKNIEVLLSQIEKQSTAQLPQELYFQLRCVKEFKNPEKRIAQGDTYLFTQNSFRYELKTKRYQLTIRE
ncbi:MAG: hypothetical protein KC505_01950 [Myxococcales bacterium]|nr:hypothetical protein [Myxococcales bacterium]USN51231.1 MAG: hypothetical protein H6731_02145 [Myxococcales bacterium]